jgi:outer membrane autotransporter protein
MQLGGILKGRYGQNAYDLSMTMGRGQFDTWRQTMNTSNGNFTTSDRDIRFVSAHAGYTYSFERENWFVRPGLDIGWTDVTGDGFDEAGGGPTALHVKGTDDAYVTSRLDLRLGGEIATRNDTLYRPFLRAAYTHIHGGTRNEIHARLAGAPDSVPDFTQVLFVDDNYTSVSVGLDILARQNWVMSFAYDRQFADRWDADSFFAKIMFGM